MLPRANTGDYGLLLCVYTILSFSVISAPLPPWALRGGQTRCRVGRDIEYVVGMGKEYPRSDPIPTFPDFPPRVSFFALPFAPGCLEPNPNGMMTHGHTTLDP